MYKGCLIFVVLAATVSNSLQFYHSSTRNRHRKTSWITQKLDNFNDNDTTTWQMRYISNDLFYKPGGPLFVVLNGETAVRYLTISNASYIFELAKIYGGYLVSPEHRYYGKSRPFIKHMNKRKLIYLNAKQALADLANFIRKMKTDIPGMNNSKVILQGCSYSGALAVWFKKLYPDLANGVLASSAVLLAKADFYEYNEVLGQTITHLGTKACYEHIKNGIATLESMFDNNRGAEVKTLMRLCNEFNEKNNRDVSELFYFISLIFSKLLILHRPNIKAVCKNIMNQPSDLDGVVSYFLNKTKNFGDCRELSHTFLLDDIRDITFLVNPWFYQQCNEFGWFQTTNSINQPFGTKIPLRYFTYLCARVFGNKFTEEYILARVDETNKMFGGLNPGVENVIFTYGEFDLWKGATIQDEKLATILPKHTHCNDVDSNADTMDPAALKLSRREITTQLGKWLAE